MQKMIKVATLSLVILGSSVAATAANAAQKIGYINTAQVFQSLPQREAIVKQMQADFKDKAAELQSIKKKAEGKIDKLKRDGELMSNDEKDQLRLDISQLQNEYKLKGQALEKASARREAEEKQKLFHVIQDATDKVAKQKGFDLIIDAQAVRFAKPELDISKDVIKAVK
ncbi:MULTISPECIES: OmpH family outer membrane protein [unclassified Vibrio]|uniref:Chaperone protein skp n=1 Tax=Vibrio sp. HB236076 TaxID=3232307 RepID=A0AB39HHW6_9VIBR|nr:OmpH family outer membrane protein [Vibrio sp. HB161653]MDP5254851.1 OmpH family outer membrane protein [Vibrio sp. HB161653]